NTPPGTTPGIGLMVRVNSADPTSAHALELGGTGKPAFDIGPTGRMAEFLDPAGAMLDVWQSGTSPGMTADGQRHGAPSWFECVSSAVPRAVEFYTALFGWTARTDRVPGWDYTTFMLGETPVAGMMPTSAEWGDVSPHWAV